MVTFPVILPVRIASSSTESYELKQAPVYRLLLGTGYEKEVTSPPITNSCCALVPWKP